MKYLLPLIAFIYFSCWITGAEAGDFRLSAAQAEHLKKLGEAKPGNRLRTPGSVSLPVSLPGALTLDIGLDFEDVTDLSLLTAGISASVVSPLDGSILARMPPGAITIPTEFPVLVLIEPPSVGLSTLAFNGIVDVTILTVDLPYYPGTRLRLFSAHDGGDFKDITGEITQGSYRVRGSGGTFSEFIVVLDARETEAVIDTKLAALLSLLSGYSGVIDSTVFANLQTLLDSIYTLWDKRRVPEAIAELDNFTAAIIAASPADIPDDWDATGGPDNVAGILRAKATTLRFSLDSYSHPLRRQ